MTATSTVGSSESRDVQMLRAECEAAFRRACFGHMAFMGKGHVDVRPSRCPFGRLGVLRAHLRLRTVIVHSPLLVLSVTELQDATHVSSVVVRGGCYETERTGTTLGDAEALVGIIELRDPAEAGSKRGPRVRRSSKVFRLHLEELRGLTASVPRRAR